MSNFNNTTTKGLTENIIKNFVIPGNLGPNNPNLVKGKGYMKRNNGPRQTSNNSSRSMENNGFKLFDFIQETLSVLGITGADTDWTKDANGVWNNTDNIGVGTKTPVTTFDIDFSSGALTSTLEAGATPDITLLGAPAGFVAPGSSEIVQESVDHYMYRTFISIGDSTLSPYIEDKYRNATTGDNTFQRLDSNNIRQSYSNSIGGKTYQTDIGTLGIRQSGGAGNFSQTYEMGEDYFLLQSSNFAVADTVATAWDTTIGISHEVNLNSAGISSIIEQTVSANGILMTVDNFVNFFQLGITPTELYSTLLTNAVDDAAASAAGVRIGGYYRNGNVVQQRIA